MLKGDQTYLYAIIPKVDDIFYIKILTVSIRIIKVS